MPKLHIVSPESIAATFELTEKLITFGRNEDNTICIPEGNISSQHGILVRDGDDYQIHDFNSTNGTFVNGQQVMAVKLKDGVSIRLGPVELRYESALAKPASSPLRPIEQEMVRPAEKSTSAKDRGMAKRTKPEYSAGSLGAGPVTYQPGTMTTGKPISPPSDKSE
ncbi:MAG TPA: FHA domain-containing protein [Verrucomicrobiae bacterium]|nr:FHA domain-containing protein [Verrucomicrobiae bacterium]